MDRQCAKRRFRNQYALQDAGSQIIGGENSKHILPLSAFRHPHVFDRHPAWNTGGQVQQLEA